MSWQVFKVIAKNTEYVIFVPGSCVWDGVVNHKCDILALVVVILLNKYQYRCL